MLTAAESKEVAATGQRRNADNCANQWEPCDPARLTRSQAAALTLAKRQRAFEGCQQGTPSCDYSLLTPAQAETLQAVERKRNRELWLCDLWLAERLASSL